MRTPRPCTLLTALALILLFAAASCTTQHSSSRYHSAPKRCNCPTFK